MSGERAALVGAAVAVAVVAGPWLARVAVRLITRDPSARPSPARTAVTTALLAVLLAGAVLVPGARPALLAVAWLCAAGLVLAQVDLAAHRLPDAVTYPSFAVCAAGLLADAVVLGTWPALLRALVAAAVAAGTGLTLRALHPAGLGLGDVKLLGLLGLVLGWASWQLVLAGVLAGLVLGSLIAVALVAGRRAGWRSAVPLGPPLLAGCALAGCVWGAVSFA